jgi:hypothetical protein
MSAIAERTPLVPAERTSLTPIEPVAPAKIQGRLLRKNVAMFVGVVCVALLANGLFEILFSYQEHKGSLIRIQHEQAEAAAAKLSQFIKEIESQVGWTTQLPWSVGTMEQRRFDALRLLRRVRPSPSWLFSMPPERSNCGYRGSPWMWWPAASTCPRSRNSPRRWRTRSITDRSISAASRSPT